MYVNSIQRIIYSSKSSVDYIILAAHTLAMLALSAARCEQCSFVSEMIA